MSTKTLSTALSVVFVLAGAVCAEDWAHWRGPTYNGVAKTPALVDAFEETGPKKLWESEKLCPGRGGYSSVSIADGRAYTYVHLLYNEPVTERVVPKNLPARFGYVAGMPKELLEKVEAARVSDERAKLSRRKVRQWAGEWTKANLDGDTRKYKRAIETRLQAGKNAMPIEVCKKLGDLAGNTYPDHAAFVAAMNAIGLDAAAQKQVVRTAPSSKRASKDYAVCLDAETGKTLWKKELPSWAMWYPASCTPTLVDGKCYVLSSEAKVYCLDAKTGEEIWTSEQVCHPGSKRNTHNRSSSVLILDGVAVVTTRGRTSGLDAKTGKVLWKNDRIKSEYGSAVPYTAGGRSVAVLVGARKVAGLDVKTGEIIWSLKGGDGSTPTIVGDHLVVTAGKQLICYRLAGEEPELKWEVPFNDAHTAPTIHDGHVYVFGEAYGKRGKGRALCVEIATGKTAWTHEMKNDHQHSSAVVADGKIITIGGAVLYLVKATPEKYTELGQARLGLEKYSSVAVADGKVYLRKPGSVVCYDLRK